MHKGAVLGRGSALQSGRWVAGIDAPSIRILGFGVGKGHGDACTPFAGQSEPAR
jgi:hypothetical protein